MGFSRSFEIQTKSTNLHYFLDGCALLADDPADEVVVSEDLEADLLLLPDVLGLLLHDLEDALAGGAAVLGLAVHGDGLLQLPELTAGRRLHFPTTKR